MLTMHDVANLPVQVRLAYAGVELDPVKDGSPFKINPKITMLQCTRQK
jgi:hypothetical protein